MIEMYPCSRCGKDSILAAIDHGLCLACASGWTHGPSVVGIDLSSHAIDLVALSENANLAEWTRIDLRGHDAWQRTRAVRQDMPPTSFWDDVYLAAIERPFGASRRGQAVLMRVEGAILASIPPQVEVWEVQPQTWKAALGYTGRGKPGLLDFPPFDLDAHNGAPWEGGVIGQDALDALGVALYARDTNAAGIAAALNPPKGQAA